MNSSGKLCTLNYKRIMNNEWSTCSGGPNNMSTCLFIHKKTPPTCKFEFFPQTWIFIYKRRTKYPTHTFGPLEYPAILSQLENGILLKFDKTNSVNGSNSAEKTRKVINSNKDNQRNSWLLVANDGVGRDHLVFFQSFDGTTEFQPFY